jgi:hypothetical protein
MHAAMSLMAGRAHAEPYRPVPYFWSDQYDVKLQAHGYLRGHDEALVLDSDPDRCRLLVAYRAGDRIAGVLAAGVSPRDLRPWRALVATRAPWEAALTGPSAA